jgi:hypothetical protein
MQDMSNDNEEIPQQLELLNAYRRTLGILLRNAALHGGESAAPVSIANQIIDARAMIRRIKIFLRDRGLIIEESPNDEPPSESQYIMRAVGEAQPPSRRAATPLGKRVFGAHNDPSAVWAILLRNLMDIHPTVREAAIVCRDRFQIARDHLRELLAYKSLHDNLQDLQISCYANIVEEAKRFPDDDQAIENLEGYCRKLNDIITGMQRAVQETPAVKPSATCVDKLAQIYTDIRHALHEKDLRLLKAAVIHIKHVLELHMGPINTELKSAARAMRLNELVQSLSFIHDVMQEEGIESEYVNQLTTWLDRLAEQNEFLLAMVNNHDQWQNVERRLRLIEGCLDQDLLGLVWPELREEATRLYATSDEEWALDLRSWAEQVERAFSPLDVYTFIRCFGNYRRRALHRFYSVDKRLLELCRSFERLDGPLEFVIMVVP